MDRRGFLATATAGGLSGCLGVLGGDGDPGPAGGTWTLPDHPALRAIADQPRRGPPPGEATGLIVAFEDPSCPTCRRFEREVYPELRSELLDPGRATFVYRGIPIVYPWGKPATYALEATFERDGAAFWQLTAHYFATQGAYSSETVLDRTEQFLADETAVDAAAVIADTRNRVHEPAVRADLTAASDAGVCGTPSFVLFAEGEFRTAFAGPQSLAVFRRALGV